MESEAKICANAGPGTMMETFRTRPEAAVFWMASLTLSQSPVRFLPVLCAKRLRTILCANSFRDFPIHPFQAEAMDKDGDKLFMFTRADDWSQH